MRTRKPAPPTYLSAGAEFSSDREYRWSLWRTWGAGSQVLFILLNPSTADEHQLDPTLRRCQAFAQRWGHGGFRVCNIFGLRSTNPAALYHAADPVGLRNDAAIALAARQPFVRRVVIGWGHHGTLERRGDAVRHQLFEMGVPVSAFGFTQSGEPLHPLYLPRDMPLTELP